jgi:hypothetical protein
VLNVRWVQLSVEPVNLFVSPRWVWGEVKWSEVKWLHPAEAVAPPLNKNYCLVVGPCRNWTLQECYQVNHSQRFHSTALAHMTFLRGWQSTHLRTRGVVLVNVARRQKLSSVHCFIGVTSACRVQEHKWADRIHVELYLLHYPEQLHSCQESLNLQCRASCHQNKSSRVFFMSAATLGLSYWM